MEAPKNKGLKTRITLVCMLATSLGAFSANPLISEENARLLVELVRTSQEYDLYNARCRGNAASTKTENSNRLFISKYRLTVNQVINLYIGKDDRAERAAMEQNFLQKAKRDGWLQDGEKERSAKRIGSKLSAIVRTGIEPALNLFRQ